MTPDEYVALVEHALKGALGPLHARLAALEARPPIEGPAGPAGPPGADGTVELSTLEARVATLETEPRLRNGGTWRHGAAYRPGDVVQFKGTRWVCTQAHAAAGAPDHTCFQLWAKAKADPPKEDVCP